MPASDPLLRVTDLSIAFRVHGQIRQVVDRLTFTVKSGEIVGIAGESGSGKTVSCLALLGLLPSRRAVVQGSVLLGEKELLGLSERNMRMVRGREIGLVYQDPLVALNPLRTIGSQVSEAARAHGELNRRQAGARVLELLQDVSLPDPEDMVRRYPHELSGGMRQRALIAIGIALNPRLLIADEPTTALDATVQTEILELLVRLQSERDMSVVLVSHDLELLSRVADRLIVMYAGRAVEAGPVDIMHSGSQHPYTRGLLRARPQPHQPARNRLVQIKGQPAVAADALAKGGCAFADRCALAVDQCSAEVPVFLERSSEHFAACWVTEREGTAPLDALDTIGLQEIGMPAVTGTEEHLGGKS